MQAAKKFREIKCVLSQKLDKYSSMAHGTAVTEYYRNSPRQEREAAIKRQGNLSQLQTQDGRLGTLYQITGGTQSAQAQAVAAFSEGGPHQSMESMNSLSKFTVFTDR